MDLTDVQRLSDDWGASDALWDMHGIPRDEVTRLIAAHGGRLLHIEDEFNPRSRWLSCTYFVAT